MKWNFSPIAINGGDGEKYIRKLCSFQDNHDIVHYIFEGTLTIQIISQNELFRCLQLVLF